MSDEFGARPDLAWLPADKLVVDHRYQRELGDKGRRKVARMARQFDWTQFGALVVAGPDQVDDYHVLDGQHRLLAARELGITDVPCCIVASEGIADEARAFVGINRDRVTATPLHVFHAAVAAGEERPVAIRDVVAAAGLVIGRCSPDGRKPGHIVAVSALRDCHRLAPDALAAALVVLARAQGEAGGALQAPLIKALTRLFAEHGTAIDHDRLVAALDAGDVDVDDWIQEARGARDMFAGKTEIALQARITQAYNKHLSAGRRLPGPQAGL